MPLKTDPVTEEGAEGSSGASPAVPDAGPLPVTVPDPAAGPSVTAAPPLVPLSLSNPLALAPTGSGAGRLSSADGFRTVVAGVSIYGLLQILLPLLQGIGMSGSYFGTYGSEIAAVAVALTHLVMKFAQNNAPAPPAAVIHRQVDIQP